MGTTIFFISEREEESRQRERETTRHNNEQEEGAKIVQFKYKTSKKAFLVQPLPFPIKRKA